MPNFRIWTWVTSRAPSQRRLLFYHTGLPRLHHRSSCNYSSTCDDYSSTCDDYSSINLVFLTRNITVSARMKSPSSNQRPLFYYERLGGLEVERSDVIDNSKQARLYQLAPTSNQQTSSPQQRGVTVTLGYNEPKKQAMLNTYASSTVKDRDQQQG